jgi:hypothetical protein
MPWFEKWHRQQSWFRITSRSICTGYHFAVMLYLGYHLKAIARGPLHSMSLVAQFDNKMITRPQWQI